MPKFNNDTEEIETNEERARKKLDGELVPRNKYAAEMQKSMQRDDRSEVQRHEKAVAPTGTDEATGVEYLSGRTFEPRCHVCQHPHRDWIEMMLIKGASYKGLEARVPPIPDYEKLDRRGISNHHKKHMDLQDSMIRAIIEREADLQQQDYAEGFEDAITKRGVLEVMLRKGYEDVVSNVTTVESRDLIQLVKLLGEMDSHSGQVAVEEARSQVQIFIQAIKNVCDLDTQSAIANEVRKLRGRENINARFEEILSNTPLVAIGVGDLEDVVEAVVIEDTDS